MVEPAALAPGAWSLAAVLDHCAASIECSLHGYPRLKPAWLRATIGGLVLRRFLRKGAMSHDRAAQVPGLPPPAPASLAAARARFETAAAAFAAAAEPLAPHLLFGAMSKADYDRFHAMHLCDHLAGFTRQAA